WYSNSAAPAVAGYEHAPARGDKGAPAEGCAVADGNPQMSIFSSQTAQEITTAEIAFVRRLPAPRINP
ncbi:MAG: hypothetical protein KBD40_08305, partial [Phenylobacterium sp.]|nr:hypothetical protein [Phenylobacterium sp.]